MDRGPKRLAFGTECHEPCFEACFYQNFLFFPMEALVLAFVMMDLLKSELFSGQGAPVGLQAKPVAPRHSSRDFRAQRLTASSRPGRFRRQSRSSASCLEEAGAGPGQLKGFLCCSSRAKLSHVCLLSRSAGPANQSHTHPLTSCRPCDTDRWFFLQVSPGPRAR